MVDRHALLAELKRQVSALEDDMREHAEQTQAIGEHLRAAHLRAQKAGRTALSFVEWREGELTQAAVAWVLACVFIRFLEDNGLIDEPLLSGPGTRLEAARGRRHVYFESEPLHSDREYLQWCFAQVARFPAVAPLYDPRHTPLGPIVPSADGAQALRELWQRIDPDSGGLVHDFTDPERSTRFLGDLYQDLSETAKKRYALLQTPEFVEELILERTLEPAIDEFGLERVRLIDPTCGSGHFLTGAFHRLLERWREREPATNVRALAQRALDAIHGVDLNPYATAIARFRLLVAAMTASGVERLVDCPAFKLNLATGDSLLHGPERDQFAGFERLRTGIAHVYDTEDASALAKILGQGYHVVVGNPPYINVPDAALRDAYRNRYSYCHGKYAMTVPFMERFFELARPIEDERELPGYVGKITANSFMKREFGKPLVEKFLPGVDVTTLIDTSGAYIPGHGTPTVILFGRGRAPVASTLRVLDAIRGEPSQPTDPARGLVWSSILELLDQPDRQDRFIGSSDVQRAEFAAHPMTLGIGRELRKALERGRERVGDVAKSLGYPAITGEDDVFTGVVRSPRGRVETRRFVTGDAVRDWTVTTDDVVAWPYDESLSPSCTASLEQALWPWREDLSQRRIFGKTQRDRGEPWTAFVMLVADKFRTTYSITHAFVATHNHFVLDHGDSVFNRHAPLIKLPAEAGEDDHLRLLGPLNSSTACFWFQEVCQNRGSTVDQHGARQRTAPFEDFFEHSSGIIKKLPIPFLRSLPLPQRLDALARERAALLDKLADSKDLHTAAQSSASRDTELFAQMVSLQEELDWEMLAAYDLVPDDLPRPGLDAPPLSLGERAFEIVLARQLQTGEVETTWFERHGSTPITAPPAHWPAEYRQAVERRIELIETDPDVGLIERPEHKRRWSGIAPFGERLRDALSGLVLDRLEAPELWSGEPRLRQLSELSDIIRRDRRLVQACELIAGDPDADPGQVVRELVLADAVPHLAALRHTDSGLRKRAVWEEVWELQRREDRGEAVGRIPVPPRYTKADFRSSTIWKLRGKLDVPKERFTLYPGAERGAGGPALGWAGWDELDRARALAARVLELQQHEAADAERLTPLLAGVLELLPWIRQWHPQPDPLYGGQPPVAFMDRWLDGTLAQLVLAREPLHQWRPQVPARGRRRRSGGASA